MAEDDADDRMLAEQALARARLAKGLHCLVDGEELMDYLHRRGRYLDLGGSPPPGLIPLDLHMPRHVPRHVPRGDACEAFEAIRAHGRLRCTPVVLLTTPRAEQDIFRRREYGASSLIAKPVTPVGFVGVVNALGTYRLDIAEPPSDE